MSSLQLADAANACYCDCHSLLTAKWIDFDGLAQLERIFDVLALDTLNAEARETAHHVGIVDHHRAHALLAAFFAHQIVRMRSVRQIFGHARNDHHRWSLVVNELNGRIGLVLGGRVRTRY